MKARHRDNDVITRRLKTLLLLACVLVMPPAAMAREAGAGAPYSDFEELDLAALLDVVITATKRPQRIEEAPAIIAVVTREDIERRGYRSVGEAIRMIPGISVVDDHTYEHVGVRGLFGSFETPSDFIKVMINGQSVAFRPLGANLLGTELIPIEAVKRIEVLRGPGSALYGANAFLGVINVITFEGAERATAPEDEREAAPTTHHAVVVEAGRPSNLSPGSVNGRAAVVSGGAWARGSYFLAASAAREDRSGTPVPGLDDMIGQHMHYESPDDYPRLEGHPSPGWNPDRRDQLMASGLSEDEVSVTSSVYATSTLQLGGAGDLTLDGNLQYADLAGEFQPYSALTHENRLTYLNGYARLRYRIDPGERGFGLQVSAALAGGEPTDDHLVDPLNPSSSKRRRFGFVAFDGALEGSYVFSPGNVASLGVDLSLDQEDLLSMEVSHDTSGTSYVEAGAGPDDETFTNVGLYAQATVTPLRRLAFTLGARLDYNTVIGCTGDDLMCFGARDDGDQSLVHLSNRAGVVYRAPFSGVYAKLLYGSSFRPPSPYQLYHNPMTIIGSRGDPQLLPMTAHTSEVIVGAKPLKGLHVNAALYYTDVNDMAFSYLESNAIRSRNADAISHGLEASIRYQWRERLDVFANLSATLYGYVEPSRRADESVALWEASVFNERIPLPMDASFTTHGGVNLRLPEVSLNVNLHMSWVGARRASLVNNLLYNNTSLDKSYAIDGYLLTGVTVSSLGLRWLGMETVATLAVVAAPGQPADPGMASIDVPGPRSRIMLRLEQRL
jgi:outer membrane receptor for ferrienterochelin and colicins